MLKFMICMIAVSSFNRYAYGQERLSWMKISDVAAALQDEKKPILVDLYTDWCGWCKVMDKKTWSDKRVARYVLEKFYAVKVNAETKAIISWSGKNYYFNPSYGANDLAVYLTGGKLSYPTTVIIPPDGSDPQAIPGYLSAKEVEVILKYFGERQYLKISFDRYRKEFTSAW